MARLSFTLPSGLRVYANNPSEDTTITLVDPDRQEVVLALSELRQIDRRLRLAGFKDPNDPDDP